MATLAREASVGGGAGTNRLRLRRGKPPKLSPAFQPRVSAFSISLSGWRVRSLASSPTTLLCALTDSSLRISPSAFGGAMMAIAFNSPELRRLIDAVGHGAGEALLLQLMPVGILHGASARRERGEAAAGTIRSLLMRRRIVVNARLDDAKVEEFGVAVILKKQRPAAVANQDPGAIADGKFAHDAPSPSNVVLITLDVRRGRSAAARAAASCGRRILAGVGSQARQPLRAPLRGAL